MRRLVSTFLINHPKDGSSVPKVVGNRQDSASLPFGTLVARDVAIEITSQRVYLGDGIYLLEPLGRLYSC